MRRIRPKEPAVHFIGIGGIGISSLAQWFLAHNWAASGSDLEPSVITEDIKKLGADVKIGHKRGHLPQKTSLVIYSRAVTPQNPELKDAKRRGIPTHSYPEEVGRLTELYRTIAIAGAHGKSTTTALTALILVKAGLDPTVIIGTRLKEFQNRNFRVGRGDYLVLEADEYKAAFLHYSPACLILTNIDKEHLDFYKDLPAIKETFLKLVARVMPNGTVIVNADDPNLKSLKNRIKIICRAKRATLIWYGTNTPLAAQIRRVSPLSGKHNLSNALAAATLGETLKIPQSKILSALRGYRGAWRRMEYRGIYHGARVFDDYAHHPTEIKASLQAFREKFPRRKLLCVFQPHQADRLAKLFPEFQSAFDEADEVLILPTYEVSGRDKKSKLDAQALVRRIQKKQPRRLVFYLADPQKLSQALSTFQPLSRRVVIMMGAGDIVNLTDALLARR